jgi:hypothetical protein
MCGLLASYQWPLYIYPHLIATFTSICHVLSNVYTAFLVLPHFSKKIVAMTYGVTLVANAEIICKTFIFSAGNTGI